MNPLQDFQGLHAGETAVVFGTGPSLPQYNGEFNDGAKLIGVNEIIYYDTLMDYYFTGDAGNKDKGYNADPEAYNNYKPNLAKFIRICDPNGKLKPPQVPMNLEDCIYYPTIQKVTGFRFNQEPIPFTDALSISFEAIQFALYAGFTKIYIVGHDCDFFRGTITNRPMPRGMDTHYKMIAESWQMLEKHIQTNYSDVRVINVNPVKMRLFEIHE